MNNLSDLKQLLNIPPDVPDEALGLTLSLKRKPEASILIADELLESLKRDIPGSKQGRFDVFVSKSETE